MRCIARAFPCVLSPRPTCLTTSSVLDTTKRNDADIEKSIEAVIQTPEVLGVRWDVEHITTSD